MRALFAVLLLGAACRRAPVEDSAETPELAAPEPSSSLVVTPLDTAATGYTNEMQAARLRREAAELGIQRIDKHIEDDESGAESRGGPPSKADRKQRVAELKRMRLEITRLRRGIESASEKSVAILGSTAAVIVRDKARGTELPSLK